MVPADLIPGFPTLTQFYSFFSPFGFIKLK